MNIVFLQGGLGNQMFQYALYLALRNKKQRVVCNIDMVLHQNQHQGYELYRLFGIKIQINKRIFFILRLMYYCIIHKNECYCRMIKKLFKLMNCDLVFDTMPSVYTPAIMRKKNGTHFLLGYWQSECYFIDIKDDILHAFHFDEKLLSSATKLLRSDIISCESVSIHVRRGDYLLEEYKDMYGGICTTEYYQKAINLMLEKEQPFTFYVFSNDIDWVRKHLDIPNPIFVDCNKGADSWQDMFLMSQCQHNIIANSSFSWWGAWLNQNPNKIVISPSRFINSNNPSDIIPEAWIRL